MLHAMIQTCLACLTGKTETGHMIIMYADAYTYVRMYACASVCLCICLYVCLSVYMSKCRSVCMLGWQADCTSGMLRVRQAGES